MCKISMSCRSISKCGFDVRQCLKWWNLALRKVLKSNLLLLAEASESFGSQPHLLLPLWGHL